LLKLENFDKELFLKRTLKNYEDMCKSQTGSENLAAGRIKSSA
jgi:hypothetical protein